MTPRPDDDHVEPPPPRPEQTDNRPRAEDGDQAGIPQDPDVDLRFGPSVDEEMP